MSKANGLSWEMDLLPSWKTHSDSECETITHSDELGALQISAARKKGEVTDEDLKDFAKEHLDAGAKTKAVTFGDFMGFGIRYDKDEAHWRQWFLRNGQTALFVTYNCDIPHRGKEDAAVDQMLATLAAKTSAL